jgi:AAA+ superfamily predicted ATPase
MVGQKDAKANLLALRNRVEVQKKRAAVGVHEEKPLHFAVLGTPGSGVSFTAKLLGRLLRELGVLERGHVVEAQRKDLVDEAEKRVAALVTKAQGGILLLSQAHTLKDPERTDSSGQEVIAELGKRMDALRRKVPVWPQNVCVVFSGPRAEVNNFLTAQCFKVAGTVELVDFSSADLTEILIRIVAKRKFTLSTALRQPGVLEDIVRKKMAQHQLRGNARNLHIVHAVIEDAVARQSTRVWEEGTVSFDGLTMLIEEDFSEPGAMAHEQETEVAKAFARLDSIVGLDSVKAFVRSLYAQLMLDAERRAAGIDSQSTSTIHMIFQGSPGTWKTTVARVVAELLKGIGWLRSGHLVEVDRGQLVAGYAGQTAIKTKAAVDSALGGVLFVDEAYALVQGDKDSFGREALDTLIKLVEDYRSELVVILAGYTDNMAELMKANPGLRSRFPTAITFPDYSSEEMMAIAEKMLLNDVLMMDPDATFALQSILESVAQAGSHSNGRTVRNIVEQAKRNQATRLSKQAKKSKEELCTLLAEDFANVHTHDLE